MKRKQRLTLPGTISVAITMKTIGDTNKTSVSGMVLVLELVRAGKALARTSP